MEGVTEIMGDRSTVNQDHNALSMHSSFEAIRKVLSLRRQENLSRVEPHIKWLEAEWRRYKYKILEMDPEGYRKIRELLKDKSTYPVILFYGIIDESLSRPLETGNQINAASHIYGYFKTKATEGEKQSFLTYLGQFAADHLDVRTIKGFLWDLTLKYQEIYLYDSLYFII
jgi:UV DNA damage endonuclease